MEVFNVIKKQICRLNSKANVLIHKQKQIMLGTPFLVVLLIVSAACGTVQMANGTQVTFNPTYASLSSSYNTVNPYGMSVTWNRLRSGSYNLFAQTYERNGQSNCKILCGPFSYPVIYNGALFCQRQTSYYSYSTVDYCVPNILVSGQISTLCNLATYGNALYFSSGQCLLSSVLNNPMYPNPASNYECCSITSPPYAEVDKNAVII